MVDYDRVKVVVFTKDRNHLQMYAELFKFILGDSVSEIIRQRDTIKLRRGDLTMDFYVKPNHGVDGVRGVRAHYVLNLTQDIDFENEVVVPMTTIMNLLDKEKFGIGL